MNLTDLRTAIALLTQLAENDAEKVMDVTGQSFGENAGYEHIGFQKKRKTGDNATDEEIAVQLLDRMREALAQKITGKSATLWWNLKPELTIGADGSKIACRVKVTATLVAVKPPALVLDKPMGIVADVSALQKVRPH